MTLLEIDAHVPVALGKEPVHSRSPRAWASGSSGSYDWTIAAAAIALFSSSRAKVGWSNRTLCRCAGERDAARGESSPQLPSRFASGQLVSSEPTEWRIIGTYSDETEARIAPFDAVPLSVADWWPSAPRDGATM
jgi:hypothetical protein